MTTVPARGGRVVASYVAESGPRGTRSTQCNCRREALPRQIRDRIRFTDCCWIWFGATTKADPRIGKEYGLLHHGTTTTRAHRTAYEILRETRLDQTDVIHHRCRQTLCVHPCHLLATDSAGNAFFERLAVCRSGRHPLHHINRTNHGRCRACMREYRRRRKWSQRGKPTPTAGSTDAEYLGCRCGKHVLCPLHPGDRTLPRGLRVPLVGTLTCCADVAATRPHRGPTPRGSANAMTALTEEDVEDIRRRSAQGEDAKLLAAEFGMTRPNLNRILRGKTWGHVGGPTKPTARRYTPTREEIENLRCLYRQIRRGVGDAEAAKSSAPFADFAAQLVARGAVRSTLSRALGLHPNAVGLFLARRERRCPLHTPAAVAGRPERWHALTNNKARTARRFDRQQGSCAGSAGLPPGRPPSRWNPRLTRPASQISRLERRPAGHLGRADPEAQRIQGGLHRRLTGSPMRLLGTPVGTRGRIHRGQRLLNLPASHDNHGSAPELRTSSHSDTVGRTTGAHLRCARHPLGEGAPA